MIRRPLIVLAALALTACTSPAATPSPAPSSSAPFDPAAALAASASGIDAGGYVFRVTAPEFEISGAVHAPTGSAEILSKLTRQTVDVTTRARVVGDRTYLQWVLYGGPWAELDSELGQMETASDAGTREEARKTREFRNFFNGMYWMAPEALPVSAKPQVDLRDPDVVGVKRLLSRVKTAQGDDLVITGTLDSSHLTEDRTMVGTLARRYPPRTGAAMPFRATLDAQDRIATLSLTTPGSADTWVISLSEYGMTPPLTAPPADTVKKPSAAVLKLLRGEDLTKPA